MRTYQASRETRTAPTFTTKCPFFLFSPLRVDWRKHSDETPIVANAVLPFGLCASVQATWGPR